MPGVDDDPLCTFVGHVEAWRNAHDTVGRNSALVTGCSAWHKARKLSQRHRGADIVCLCGLKGPSRPHLIWSCAATAAERIGVSAPSNRVEARMLARVVPEVPPPPVVGGYDNFIQELAAVFTHRLNGHLLLATDGQCC